jgi:DNA-binding transcriptional LysR family regulator
MNNLEIKQLNYFLQVAQLLNINETARQLGISQPAVTRQIQQIEESVGMTLFRRSPNGLKLTPAGNNFRHRAQAFVDSYTAIIQHSMAVHRASEGTVILGVDAAMFLGCPQFGHLLAEFKKLYPRYKVRPVDVFPDGALSQLTNREVDLLLTMRGRSSDTHDIVDSEIIREGCTEIIVRSDHQFAGLKSLLFEQLHDVPLVMLNEDSQPGFYDDLLQNFDRMRSRMIIKQRASTETTLLAYVRANIGIALVNGCVLSPSSNEFTAIEVEGLDLSVPTKIELLTRKGESYPALDAFKAHFVTQHHRKTQLQLTYVI